VTHRFTVVVATLALLTAGSAGVPPDLSSPQVQGYQPPKPAPALSVPSLDGRTVRLEDFRGKVVLLFFEAG
jgi:cytochrome oxidase Cu insertion factor (SCO1/SenC/PrrC family)